MSQKDLYSYVLIMDSGVVVLLLVLVGILSASFSSSSSPSHAQDPKFIIQN